MATSNSNFEFLKSHDPLLFQLALRAERSFVPDPNTTLIKLRQLGETLAQDIAARVGIKTDSQTRQIDLLRDIDLRLRLDRSVTDAFHQLRKLGNAATHDISAGSHKEALDSLQIAWVLSVWFHRTFGGDAGRGYTPGKFIKPQDPSQELRELEQRIRLLEAQQQRTHERLKISESLREAEAERALAEARRAEQMRAESAIWEELAQEHERSLTELRRTFDGANDHRVSAFVSQTPESQSAFIQTIESTPLDLSEAQTRLLIDRQLIDAGWIADSENLRFSKGARPEPNRCKAIAEWPTASGPADYILFDGLTPVAAIEAKKKAKDAHAAIDQAKRYSRDFDPRGVCESDATGWGAYRIPLVFATNGRPYLKQLERSSGIWFLDVRAQTNPRRVLQGWYTPEGIRAYLKQNRQQAEQRLDGFGFDFKFSLRPYQREAIQAVESAIKSGQRNCLVAMATGTGKTKTCIALIYRLLKAERFRRVLFLVDRSALGEQAADAFNETRMERETFAECFGIKELTDREPEDDTMVHIATVQGMVKRILYSDEMPSVDQYDCIVVDECHRGYLLDRELDDTELQFRDQNDYISKYRRVLEYFDAVKIGLTATPALHTTNIFGTPVFTYSYPEAVIDGYLVDHLPPIRIKTALSEGGIHFGVGEEVPVYTAGNDQLEIFTTPDELDFDVSQFNRGVLNDNFNREVCKKLVELIDPYLPAKTLIFCATDRHADTVVQILKEEYRAYMGEVEDDAIAKITGQSDKPLELIKKYKNDRLPNIAVTVDLLTTGVDVPKICNLVFLRRVNSRILYEQMLGRATRLCEEIDKEAFRIYDAVNLYDSLQKVNTMKPVVTDPDITFTTLIEEMRQGAHPELQQRARDQFLAKLNSKGRHLSDERLEQFETLTGMAPRDFVKHLKAMELNRIAEWFTKSSDLGELLDARTGGVGRPQIVSNHDDHFLGIEHGYGSGQKPEDYLRAFEKFIKENSNRLPALQVVIQRPWELSRRSLKELAIELERHHFREQDLKTAWAELKNEEIAARIIGFIRQAAIGEALVPWEERVDRALSLTLALRSWTPPQKHWLQAVAKQMKAATIVDQEALDDGVLKDQFGGFRRADRLFEGKVVDVLDHFRRALWQA